MSDWIALEDCGPRHIYRLDSRNLRLGVFNLDTKGFIGIRLKFGNRFLFTEYHWDTGEPYGTAKPLEDRGPLDDTIELRENDPTVCGHCGEPVTYELDPKRRWIGCKPECGGARPFSTPYKLLFDLLDGMK